MDKPLVVVVILNTNRRADTLACLASLAANGYENWRALVLDNASSDGSVAAIRQAYPQVEILELTDNRGYAGNNNIGIQAAMERGAEWVLVLNEDTVLAPDCLERLVEAGESDPAIGMLGPLVYHFDEPEIIQSAGGMLSRSWTSFHRGQNEVDLGQYQQIADVEWVSGCAILVRRKVIEEAGALDDCFFYYWEETEWCLRAGRLGWRVVHAPQARLWHKGVQRDYRPGPSVTYYSTRNRLKMLAKHRANGIAWLGTGATLTRTFLSWTLKPKWRGMQEHRLALWQAVRDFVATRCGVRPA